MSEKRTRVVTLKPTRQGCRTCRLRRVKCDESRPFCHRCTKSGKECSGYAPTGSPRYDTATRQLLPSEPQTRTAALCSPPFPALDATDYERHAFDHFRRTIAGQLNRKTSRARIIRLVLDLSLELPVFRAIAALGSIHRGLVQVTLVGSMHTLSQDSNALHQYGRAIATLQRHIGESQVRSSPYLEPVLCACILLASCEIVKNDSAAAISHLRFGRKISTTYDACKQSQRSYDGRTFGMLVSMFELLEQSCLDVEIENSVRQISALPICPSPSPDFRSFRVSLDRLIAAERNVRMEFLQLAHIDSSRHPSGASIAQKWCVDHCKSRTIKPRRDSGLSTRLQQLITQHASWMVSFKATLDTLDLPLENEQSRRILILFQIQHFYSAFLLITCRSTREVPHDIFHDEYCRILDLAEVYLSDTCSGDELVQDSSDQRSNFAVGLTVLPALYLIALKCRDSVVRRRAIRLLASTDRLEGFQKSQHLAAFANRVVAAEERRARVLMEASVTGTEPLTAKQVPEAARFLDVVVSMAPRRPWDMQIVGGRFAYEREGELEVTNISAL